MIGLTKFNPYLEKGSRVLLILMVFMLPLSLFLNNLFLSIFLGLFGIYTILNFSGDTFEKIKKDFFLLIILNIPLVILLIGMTYSPETKQGLKELGRLVPIILMVFFVVLNTAFFSGLIKQLLSALVLGCVVSAAISWGGAIVEIYQNGDAIFALFSKEYAYHELSERIGIHTPYLGLFVNTSIGFCVYSFYDEERILSKKFLIFSMLFLIVFLFNLMARNAIFCFILFGLIFLVNNRKYFSLTIFIGILAAITVFTFATEKNFLRDRFFKSVNIFENETIFSKRDGRFDRLSASFEVFKQFPLIGPGTANEDGFRREQYYINRDSEAYNDNYNAHNQLMEYLSTYGILGGLSYVVLFLVLFKLVFDKKSYFLLFVLSCFFIANISESLMERSWGIIYYILIVVLILSWDKKSNIKMSWNA